MRMQATSAFTANTLKATVIRFVFLSKQSNGEKAKIVPIWESAFPAPDGWKALFHPSEVIIVVCVFL